jgi:putative ATP-dependent endonuclease of the OLD family
MRIRHLSVRNFRGIREMDWALPDKAVFCLIGRGDSTKSTVLEALRRAFYPQWNLAFDDADFHECLATNKIAIEVVLGSIPDDFRDLENYGQALRGWDPAAQQCHDEPGEGLEDALCVRLTVGEDLEPSWRVVKNKDDDGIAFKVTDRAKVSVALIGALSDRHLTWSHGSLLSRLTGAENISSSLAGAGRAARAALEQRRDQDLTEFDKVASTAEATARSLGVGVAAAYKAHLDCEAINVRIGGLALHDGDMPLRQLGLGSKRMLTTGLQKQNLRAPHITLFDEVEIGLEPHRIARLLNHLKGDPTGQYFLTTHSPVVLRELTVDDLYITHSKNGKTQIVPTNQPAIADCIQGKMRAGAEAFLAPKVIVCEGATEAGLLRGLDDYWISKGNSSFAYQGIACFDAIGANKIRELAEALVELSYDVAILADSDAPDQFSDADADHLRAKQVAVTKWDGAMSIEERVFADLPWPAVLASFEVACTIHGDRGVVLNQVQTHYGGGFDRNPAAWVDETQLRTALGKAAKTSDWFKRQSWAREWAAVICGSLDDPAIAGSDLVRKLTELRGWINRV